jgi:hypothetical protein
LPSRTPITTSLARSPTRWPQKLDPSASEPDDTAQVFAPKRRKINTFLADKFIVKTPDVDAHNNVTNPTVGRLVAKTILA